MAAALSARLREIVDALPLRPGMRVLEIGCGPGAMARAIPLRLHGRGFARAAIKAALKPDGILLIDGGDPLRQVDLG